MTAIPDSEWTEWGVVEDRKATLGIIVSLQKQGFQVRVVADRNRNTVYTRKVTGDE